MSDDTALAQNLVKLILDLNLTPRTTLSQPTAVGDQTLQVGSSAGFAIGGTALFDDQLGEELLTITAVGTGTITLDFTGVGYTGVRQIHAAGTTVYTNLQPNAPLIIDPMLEGGQPVIWVMADQQDDPLVAMGARYGPTFQYRIQEHRLLLAPHITAMNPNVWANRQQTAARADFDTIRQAIFKNPHLQKGGFPLQALGLGEKGNTAKPVITTQWRKLTISADTQQFMAYMEVLVRGPLRGQYSN